LIEKYNDSPSVWKIAPNDKRNLLLSQLFDGNLKRIRHSFHVNQHWRISTECICQLPLLDRRSSQVLPYLICKARVPNTRALSYLVMYGVVVRFSLGTFLSLMLLTVFRSSAFLAASASPLTTMLLFRFSGSSASGSSAPPCSC